LSPKSQDHLTGIFSEESMNWTVSGAYPIAVFVVNWATGTVALEIVVLVSEELEFVPLAERPVPLIVVSCAGTITGSVSLGVGIVTKVPTGVVVAGKATYCSGSGGSAAVGASVPIPCFTVVSGVVGWTEHPAVLTSRMMRIHATVPGLYIDNF
jgi:hypothetical protein